MRPRVPEGGYVLPAWSANLRNLYWFVRFYGFRDLSRRRGLYRRIAKEKRAVTASGVDPEYVRLVCLFLADPRRENRAVKCLAFEAALGVLDRLSRVTRASSVVTTEKPVLTLGC